MPEARGLVTGGASDGTVTGGGTAEVLRSRSNMPRRVTSPARDSRLSRPKIPGFDRLGDAGAAVPPSGRLPRGLSAPCLAAAPDAPADTAVEPPAKRVRAQPPGGGGARAAPRDMAVWGLVHQLMRGTSHSAEACFAALYLCGADAQRARAFLLDGRHATLRMPTPSLR